MASLIIILLLCGLVCRSLSIDSRFYRSSGKNDGLLKAGWFSQTLDHFAPQGSQKFQQRYFENLEHWQQPNGPIFLIICGESFCSGTGEDYRLALAKEFGAAMVALEHRYYGESHPFSELTTKNLSYLSSKQAVVDLASFRQYFQASLNKRFFRPAGFENPWIVIGVSYSGALSAWFHLKFPHLTKGALASSAVVNAVLDFKAFDQQAAVSAGSDCANLLRKVTSEVEKELEKNATLLKSKFSATELTNDEDFLYYLADSAVFPFQYGSPNAICDPLLRDTNEGKPVLDSYIEYIKNVFVAQFGGDPKDYDRSSLQNTSVHGPDAVSRAWWYQCCTEVAYFQTAPGIGSVRSTRLDLRYFLGFCKDVFGIKDIPDTEFTNLYYGGENISSSNIFFVNGLQDPWQHASVKESRPGMPSRLVRCDNCGHGSELRGCPQWPASPLGDVSRCSSPDSVNDVREEIKAQFRSWLSESRGNRLEIL